MPNQRCLTIVRAFAAVAIIVTSDAVPAPAFGEEAAAPAVEKSACGGAARAVDPRPQPAGAIHGQIFDDAHKPVRGASVSVQKVDFTGGMSRNTAFERTVLTNAKGEYRVGDVPPSQYYVSAVMKTEGSFTDNPRDKTPRSQRAGFGPTFYPGATSFVYAHRVSVYPGEQVAGIDITLQKKPLARLSGKLLGSRQALKDGAYVSLTPAASVGRAGLKGFVGVSRVSPEGDFMIDAVPPGEYVLAGRSIPLRDIEQIALTGRSAPLTADPDAEFVAMPVTVDGTDTTNLQLMLARSGRVRGKVTIDGRPFNPGRSGVGIRAAPARADSLSAGNNDARIKTDGGFEIGGMLGAFVLRLMGDERSITLSRVEADGLDITDTGVVVDPNEDVANVDVILTTRPSEVSGRIMAGNREEPGGCWVIVFAQEPERWSWAETRYVRSAPVGPDDTFRVVGLPRAKYLAVVVTQMDEGQWRNADYLRSLVREAKSFELREGERKQLDLPLKSK
jgi:hypothetical protein